MHEMEPPYFWAINQTSFAIEWGGERCDPIRCLCDSIDYIPARLWALWLDYSGDEYVVWTRV